MDLKMLKNTFYKLIESNKTKEALDLLEQYVDEDERKQLVHLRSEFNAFESEKLIQDAETIGLSRARIRKNIIALFCQLEVRLLQAQIDANEYSKQINQTSNTTKKAIYSSLAQVKILWLFKQTENKQAFSISEIQKKCNFSDRGIIYNAIQFLNESQFIERIEGNILRYQLSPRGKRLIHGMQCELSFQIDNSGTGLLDTND